MICLRAAARASLRMQPPSTPIVLRVNHRINPPAKWALNPHQGSTMSEWMQYGRNRWTSMSLVSGDSCGKPIAQPAC